MSTAFIVNYPERGVGGSEAFIHSFELDSDALGGIRRRQCPSLWHVNISNHELHSESAS